MTNQEIIQELKRTSHIDKHRCLGCGHEHSCGIHGCAVANEAIARICELESKLKPTEPNSVYEDEALCPYCNEVVDESSDYHVCSSCGQVMDWSGW